MDNIQFDDNQFQSKQPAYQPQAEKGMVGWVIRKGIAKDARTANIILLAFALVLFAATYFIMKKDSTPTLTPEQIEASRQSFQNQLESARQNQ